jgi:hypothetical protein
MGLSDTGGGEIDKHRGLRRVEENKKRMMGFFVRVLFSSGMRQAIHAKGAVDAGCRDQGPTTG